MARLLDKYTGILKALKPLHTFYNFINRDKLQHNRTLYHQFGLKKNIYTSIGSSDFKKHSTEIPWIDKPNALDKIAQNTDFQRFKPEIQAQIIHFIENGYMILRGWISPETAEDVNIEVDRLLGNKQVDFNFSKKKIMMAHEQSKRIDALFRQKELLDLLSFLMGKKVIPFQTINFIEGSEQRPHSDSIHMTTEPQGYLIAAWWALEDCDEGNGPLVYYPKSHRLPYLMTENYDSGNTALMLGSDSNRRYEDAIEATIKKNNFKPSYFHAKKGDILIWHANLIHGGTKILRKGSTRKSMVAHYFTEGVICYHELSQRPALMKY
jgi:ectoine hydroxylase